jgi:hypothetical protein
LPGAIEVKLWEWAPEPNAIAEYLRHIVLPKFLYAANGIDIAEEVEQSAATLEKTEDLLSRVTAEGAYPDDVKFLVGQLNSLDSALRKDDALVLPALNSVAVKWNSRFASTQGMGHEIHICATPEEVGQTALERAAEEAGIEWDDGEADSVEVYGYFKEKWLDLCRRALHDKQEGEAFLTALGKESNS